MSAIHAATASPLVRELVRDVRNEITRWLDLKRPNKDDGYYLVLDIMEELDDHLQIPLAITLATFGIDATEESR